MTTRTEFGYPRKTCACEECSLYCRFMPGTLIPADLARLIPKDVIPTQWAENNLLASPGALVMRDQKLERIRTLVPATKSDGSCIHLTCEGRCAIHENAPFACAFFDHDTPPRDALSVRGLIEVMKAWATNHLYAQIWLHLDALGKKQHPPEVLRQRMQLVQIKRS